MEQYVIYLFFILLASIEAQPSNGKQYRSDYEYNTNTDAFYKLHNESVRHSVAKEICEMEGAQLMVPDSDEDIAQAHGMMKKFPNFSRVIIGEKNTEPERADEEPIIKLEQSSNERVSERITVMTSNGELQKSSIFSSLPFICKVAAKRVPYDERCGVHATGYEYFASVGSCYKVPQVAYTWDEACDECLAEGAHLVIINSNAEHDVVKKFLRNAPSLSTARADFFFFVGFRANKPTDGSARVFRTVFNQTLDEAGYNVWAEGEPNNFKDTEYCGSIFKNDGKFNDLQCSHLFGFICEKEL